MSSYAFDLLDAAEAALAKGDIDTAESLVGSALKKAKQAADDEDDTDDTDTDTDDADDTGDTDDGDFEDDWSEPATSKTRKALRDLSKVSSFGEKYVNGGDGHVNMSHNVGHRHHPETYPTGVASATGARTRTKFDALVEHVRGRDNVSRSEAMTRARQEFPRAFQSHLEHHASLDTTSAKLSRHERNPVGKRAGGPTFEELVSAEMAKGCNFEIAGQRVCQMHGFRAMDNRSSLAKSSERIADRWEAAVYKLADDYDISLDEACRELRKRDPALFRALQVT
jgi:hypothetical protein